MDDTAAGLRRRLFNAAARMRKQRQEPPAPKGITPAEMYAIMAVSRLRARGGRSGPVTSPNADRQPRVRIPDLEIA